MKKINVGIFTYDFYPIFGGQGRHVYELYKQSLITQSKFQISIFSPSSNNLPKHFQLFPKSKSSLVKNLNFSILLNMYINKIIKKYELDLIHFQGGPGGIFLFNKVNKPVIYTSHHTYWQQFKYIKSQKWKYYFYLLEKRGYQFSNRIICVSKDTRKIINDKYNIGKSKTTYIPNGINLELCPLNKRLNNNRNILYVGRIDKRKGVDFLINTMKILNQFNIKLHIIGEGKDRSRLENLCLKNNLNVNFYGYLTEDEKKKIYEKISIQIVPSIFEGFGISVLEGMANKKAIVATDSDGIRTIIKNNYSGMLVKYGDEQELSKIILDLIENEKLQQRLVNNAYSELNKYNWHSIYINTLKVYESLSK